MRAAVTLEQCWHRVPGGTARAAIDQIAALDGLGAVDLVGVSARHRHPPPSAWTPPVAVEQLPIPRLLMYEGWHHLGWPHVEDATGPVDLIHATGYAIPPRTVPLVVTLHDLIVLHDPSVFTRRGVSFLRTSIERTKERADLVLCSSRSTIDDCLDNGFDADRLRLVPLGVEPRAASTADIERVRSDHGLPDRYVLSVATREPRKNLARLLAAFEQLVADGHDDLVLVLAGPPGWGPDLGDAIGRLGVHCIELGFVDPADLAPLYAGATAFAFPSTREGFGLPVLEAMAQGTPVVTSAGTSTEELVEGGAGLAVDPLDIDALTGALASILDDPQLAARLGDVARERARSYTWERTAELTLEAYRDATR